MVEGHAALLCIDLQYLDAARGHGVFRDAENSGVAPEAQEYYFDRLDQRCCPIVRRLQDVFRSHDLEVIHTRIQSLTRNGRDRSKGHRRLGLLASPGSSDADFLEAVAPLPIPRRNCHQQDGQWRVFFNQHALRIEKHGH